MQCPACDHEAPQADFGSPLRCPECGSYYEKAMELKQKRLLEAQRKDLRRAAPSATPSPEPKKKRSWLKWLFVGMMVVGFLNAMLNVPPKTTTSAQPSARQAEPNIPPSAPLPSEKDLALQNTGLEYEWGKDGEALMVANFTVINGNSHDIKDIEVTCIHFGSSGTEIDSNTRTIYEIIPAGGKKTFKHFDMGFIHSQAVKSDCSIVDLKI